MAHAADPEAGDVVPQHLLNLPPVGKWVGMADTTTAVFFHGTEIVWAKAGQPPVHHATPGAGQLLHVLLGSNNVVVAINPIVRRAYKIKGPVWRADGHVDEPEHIATTPVPSDAPAPSAVLLPGGRTVVAVFAVDQVVGYDANYVDGPSRAGNLPLRLDARASHAVRPNQCQVLSHLCGAAQRGRQHHPVL
jgi:hypothetical protein